MRNLFIFIVLFTFSLICSLKAHANSTTYYAKCTVEVAEDSQGLGSVYILTNDEQEVSEATGQGDDYGGMNSGASVAFEIYTPAAEGYVFAHFTDQYGEVHQFQSEELGNPHMIGLWAMSTDIDDPTVYNLAAHFIDAASVANNAIAEVTVSGYEVFGTFISPVDAEIPADFNAYYVTGVTDGTTVLQKIETGVLPAFTPVVLENVGMFDASFSVPYNTRDLPGELPSMSYGVLTGTLEGMTLPEGAYVLDAEGYDGSSFVKSTSESVVDPYHCYLTYAEEGAPESIGVSLTSVSVEGIASNIAAPQICDVLGRRMTSLGKGINIVNGKKIIVK